MVWLGTKHGYLTDWVTQQWVRLTGQRYEPADYPWLEGAVGPSRRIGFEAFDKYAADRGLVESRPTGCRGILPRFDALAGDSFSPDQVHPSVRDFYEATSEYELDAWSEWSTVFKPGGALLARLFSRRLQQLNIPLSGLDTSRGMSNTVQHWVEPGSDSVELALWLRSLQGSGNVLYSGSYSVCTLPSLGRACVKVVFPLPNGRAIVIMSPTAHEDGSLELVSRGERFGHPGFYLVVQSERGSWVKYVRTMRETIVVHPGDSAETRADHRLTIWGMNFLSLHYRMRRTGEQIRSLGSFNPGK